MTRRTPTIRPRTAVVAAVVAAVLALLGALLLGTAGVGAAEAAGPRGQSWGRTHSEDHVLRGGCHDYAFRYGVRSPSDDWMAELELHGPRGGKVASHTFYAGTQPAHGLSSWRVCSTVSRPGRFTITMKVSSYVEDRATVRRGTPSTFRFTPRD